ncbi:MAG: flagellar M-ring protein FliF [Rickettsiales bacterium]|nr:flagellar M-ring protein FliF [Rickettsiales bacterium]
MNAMVQSLRELSQMKLIALAATALFLIGFFIFLSVNASSPLMAPLYSNISLEESGAIVQELEKANVPYTLALGGSQILVPADKVEEMRVKLAQLGMPSAGSMIGYEIFDKSESLGTSNFVLNVNKLRALEGELGRTISSLSKVEQARVHLVIPKRELFTREKTEPTASVALKVRGAAELDKNEIAAIKHLVATAVPGLKPTRITIIDQNGNMLARGVEDENDPDVMAANAQEFRVSYENKLKSTIERLLERSLGTGNVKAEVNADIDFDRVVTNSETFDPEGQVARSIQGIEENEKSSEKDQKDNVSVGQNLPDAQQNQGTLGTESQRQRTDETTNYEISKTVENHIKQTGTVNRLSIAVLVDGTYITNDQGSEVYTARSEQEIQQLESLVRSAVGYDEARGDKVDVINMQFAREANVFEEGPLDFLKQDLSGIVQTLVLGGVAILFILLVIRPLVSRAISTNSEAETEEEEMKRILLGGPSMTARLSDFSGEEDEGLITIDRVDGGIKSSTMKKINELIETHPDEAMSVIRGWAFVENNS